MDKQNIIGCAMSLISGQEAALLDGQVLSPQNKDHHQQLIHAIGELLASSDIKSNAEFERLTYLHKTLSAIAPFGSRYISNKHDHYFIVQCELDFDLLDDALEHESLDDMYDSMAIAHDVDRDRFESTAIIIRQLDGHVQACDLRGCWAPLANKFAWRLEDWINDYYI